MFSERKLGEDFASDGEADQRDHGNNAFLVDENGRRNCPWFDAFRRAHIRILAEALVFFGGDIRFALNLDIIFLVRLIVGVRPGD